MQKTMRRFSVSAEKLRRDRRCTSSGGGLSALIGGVLFVVGILAAMWYSHKLKLRNEAPFAITERL